MKIAEYYIPCIKDEQLAQRIALNVFRCCGIQEVKTDCEQKVCSITYDRSLTQRVEIEMCLDQMLIDYHFLNHIDTDLSKGIATSQKSCYNVGTKTDDKGLVHGLMVKREGLLVEMT